MTWAISIVIVMISLPCAVGVLRGDASTFKQTAREFAPRLVAEGGQWAESGPGPLAFERRLTRRVELGPTAAVGADLPVRVEVGFGRPAALDADALAASLARLAGPAAGDRRLEIACFDVCSPNIGPPISTFASFRPRC